MHSAFFQTTNFSARVLKKSTLIVSVNRVIIHDFIILFFKESGTVDFEEFICMMSQIKHVKTTKEQDDELKEIFDVR